MPMPEGTLLNVNAPAGDADRVEVCRLGKRIFRDELKLVDQEGDARRRYWMYGAVTGYHEEDGHGPRGHRRRPHRGDARCTST